MSKLAKDSAAFKNVLKRQDYTSWHSQPGSSAPATPAPAPVVAEPDPDFVPSGKKKPRPKSNVVWSQPADTGSGNNVNTQLVYAVDYLKSTPNPTRLEDIALLTNTPLLEDPVLLEKFKAHERISYNPKTDLYSYKHLKEAWKEAPAAIEELEAEGEVLVTRTVKDGQLRMVFWNEIKPTPDSGGAPVEQEFMDLWHGLNLPDDVELRRELAKGLSPKAPIRAQTGKKKGKRGGAPRQRQVRLTNTHLSGDIDLTRDYAPPGK
ncbi:transcription initiation factor IIE subunit beta [Mycena polygramma]|nr:transcription initiation factor IIE subunit beta [Mycena polygramma]